MKRSFAKFGLGLTLLSFGLKASSVVADINEKESDFYFGAFPSVVYDTKDLKLDFYINCEDVEIGPSGELYAVNRSGLLHFDGVSWTHYNQPELSLLQRIYVIDDKLILTTFSKSLVSEERNINPKIISTLPQPNENDYFTFLITPEGEKYSLHNGKDLYYTEGPLDEGLQKLKYKSQPLIHKNRLLILHEIYRYDSEGVILEGFKTVPSNVDQIPKHPIIALPSNHQSKRWTVIGQQGVIRTLEYDEQENLFEIVKTKNVGSIINGVTEMDSQRLVLSTATSGLMFLEESQNVEFIMNRENSALDSNQCFDSTLDEQGGLWIGTDKGIIRIQYKSPIRYFDPSFGIEGTVGSPLYEKNRLHYHNQSGLITCEAGEIANSFEIRQTHRNGEEINAIKKVGNQIIEVGWKGLKIWDEELKKLLRNLPNEGNVIEYSGTDAEYDAKRNILYLMHGYRLSANRLIKGDIERIARSTTSSDEYFYRTDLDWNGNIWATSGTGKIAFFETSKFQTKDNRNFLDPRFVTDLPKDLNTTLEIGVREVITSSGNRIFRIDPITKKVEEIFPEALRELPSDVKTMRLSHLEGSIFSLSILNNGESEHILFSSKSEVIPEKFRWIYALDGFRCFASHKDQYGNLWFVSGDASAKIDFTGDTYIPPLAKPYIRKLKIGDQDIEVERDNPDLNLGGFGHEHDELTIKISFPSYVTKYDASKSNKFYFQLNDSEHYQEENHTGEFSVRSLKPGSYTLKIQARDALNRMSDPIQLHFKILPPFYASWCAIMLYILLSLAAVYAFTAWRLAVQKDKMWEERVAMERRLNLETSAKEAQIQALRLQINPHFLFNSLQFIAQSLKDRPEIKRSVEQLAKFLNRALDDKNTELVELRSEIESVEEYLDIENRKGSQPIVASFEVEEKVANTLVPGLILQPLVENAIKYGTPNDEGNLTIIVAVIQQGDRVAITVTNSGEWVEARDGRSPIGLQNVEKRLKLQFGSTASLKHRHDDASKTVSISLNIPM